MKFRAAPVRQLLVLKRRRDDANHFPACVKHRVGYDAHQPDATSAKYKSNPARRHFGAKASGRRGINGVGTR